MISIKREFKVVKKPRLYEDPQFCIKLYNEFKYSTLNKKILAQRNNLTLYIYERCIFNGFELVEENKTPYSDEE